MKYCSKCAERRYMIISKITFGHGDSTTETYCQCIKCDNRTQSIYEPGFPATVETIRKVQSDYIENYQRE